MKSFRNLFFFFLWISYHTETFDCIFLQKGLVLLNQALKIDWGLRRMKFLENFRQTNSALSSCCTGFHQRSCTDFVMKGTGTKRLWGSKLKAFTLSTGESRYFLHINQICELASLKFHVILIERNQQYAEKMKVFWNKRFTWLLKYLGKRTWAFERVFFFFLPRTVGVLSVRRLWTV